MSLISWYNICAFNKLSVLSFICYIRIRIRDLHLVVHFQIISQKQQHLRERYNLENLVVSKEQFAISSKEYMNHLAKKSSKCFYCDNLDKSNWSRINQGFHQQTSAQSQNVFDYVHGVPHNSISVSSSSNKIANINNIEQLKQRIVSSNYTLTGRPPAKRAPSCGQKSTIVLETLPVSHHIKKSGRPKLSRY